MYYELSKREKKIARACIDKAVEAEFRESMESFEAIIQDWRLGKLATHKDAYQQLYKAIKNKDKAIARRYDDITGSTYLITVATVLHDGYITDEDIKELSEEAKAAIYKWHQVWKSI